VLLDVFPTGPIQANCVIVGDPAAGVGVVVDPGDEGELVARRLESAGVEPLMIVHTHGHLDHAAGTAELLRRLGAKVPVALHPGDLELYRNLPLQGRLFGIEVEAPPEPSVLLADGQRIPVGGLELEVRHAPGHSPGSVCLVVHGAPEPLAIVGDVLFAGSIGRTDLWGGSFEELARSIRERVYTLPPETRVICGHGPSTTVGHEARTNPFVRRE